MVQADTGTIIEEQNEPPTAKNGWQATTCTTDAPKCSPETPLQFYLKAGGHPPVGFTQYTIAHTVTVPETIEPIKETLEQHTIKTLRVDLPPGLTVNPNATPEKCTLAEFLHVEGAEGIKPQCAGSTQVGEEQVYLVTNEAGAEFPPGSPIPVKGARIPLVPTIFQVPVYNLTPNPGEPALFGFVVAHKEPVFLKTQVAWESDFHESFTIELPDAEVPGLSTLISRLVNFGQTTGNGTYINNPTNCVDPAEFPSIYSTWFRAESYAEPDPNFPSGSTPVEAKLEDSSGQMYGMEGCDTVPFTPGINVHPGADTVDWPADATVATTLNYLTGAESEQQESHLRKAVVDLPEGMGLNPSGSNGLVACTDAQFKKGVRTYVNECPAASKIGSVVIQTPPLAKDLTGDIYVGEQKSSNPASGEQFRILVEAKEQEEGVDVRLVGHVQANANNGQLTAVFDEQEIGPLAGKLPQGLPQVPFTSVALHFDGAKEVLTMPPTCSKAETVGEMEPWARPGEQAQVTDSFTPSKEPAGGTCPTTMADRKFAPSYTAASDSSTAGKYSPFRVSIGRPNGQQEVKAVNVTLPKGLTGNLSGIPYCSEAALTAAASASGKAEQANPSCPSASRIGSTSTTAGTGTHPITLPGSAYLAGPYKGAPLSMAVITPAVSGPFDLGTVVVRVALNVNPETAQINAVSDAIPNVFGGVKLDLVKIDVNVDRAKFMLNPTNCAKQATAGSINGGGADPTNAAAWSSYAVSAPFHASMCNKLGFKPKLHVRLKGPTKRNKFPQLRAVLQARNGDANVARTALTLPHSLFLEQGHIGTVCTRPQLASHTCPKASVYGHAEAVSPLLDKKLKGNVYLVSSNHKLPDLLADMRGQVEIYLRGVISSKHGGLKTVFNNTPDVPVKKVILNMQGGQKSLLVNSTNTCAKTQRAVLNIKGQNGKKVKNNKFRLNITSCGKKHK